MTEQPEIFVIDLDEELLSHLADPDAWVVMQGEEITAELIEDDFVAEVFNWQRAHLREHGQLATASVLTEQFDLDLVTPQTAIGDLLDRIRDRYMRNQGREALREIVQIQKEDPLDVPQLLLKRGRELNNLLSKRGEVFGTGDYDRAMRRYDIRAMAGPGASFGHQDLDEHFYGMRGLNFLIAYKKTFKSWQMVQCCAENVLAGRCTWLYPLELPAEETDARLRFMLADIPWWKYVHNKVTIEDRKRLKEASDIIDGCGIYKIKKPPTGSRGIMDLVHVARDAGAEVILIDQLQYIENDKGHSLGRLNDTGEYFGVLDDARNLSDEGPLYIAHQFGRQAMGAESMPDIALAKGSSAIEEVCTLSLGMWANKEMRRQHRIEIGTLISRNHTEVSWEMEFDMTRGCNFTILGRAPEIDDG